MKSFHRILPAIRIATRSVLLAVCSLSAFGRVVLIPVDEDTIVPVPRLSIVGNITLTGADAAISITSSSGASLSVSQSRSYAFDYAHFGQAVTYRVAPAGLETSTILCTSTPAYRDVVLGPQSDVTGVDFAVNCALKTLPATANDATFVSQWVPTAVQPGQTFAVKITMYNAGSATWTSANQYQLGSQNTQDNTTWELSRVNVPSVVPGASVDLNFNATAPTIPGTYNFQWRMVQNGTSWFGASTSNVAITVGTNDAAFVTQTVPTSMNSGQTYPVTVTMRNTGNTTWPAGTSYRLGAQNPTDNTTWTSGQITPSNSVAPGASVMFTFNVTAPASAGTYNFQWRMAQGNSWFGSATTNAAIAVQSATSAPKTYYVHADHLGTPREVTRSTDNQVMWRWDNTEPFGNSLVAESPSGLPAFKLGLRFPGQYYDVEMGTDYNYFRDFDPSIGRYIESDPIGLRGGINTYAYVLANPLRWNDIRGLAIWLCNRQVTIAPYVGNHTYFWNDKNNQCCGRNQGHDPLTSCSEKGPGGGDSCVKVPGTDGQEDNILGCCQRTANEGTWIPFKNDCHDSADRCLKRYGISNPGPNGGRLGSCESCWLRKDNPEPPPIY